MSSNRSKRRDRRQQREVLHETLQDPINYDEDIGTQEVPPLLSESERKLIEAEENLRKYETENHEVCTSLCILCGTN